MAIKWRRNTTYTVAQDILNLLNISCVSGSPRSSKYYWKLLIDQYSQNISTHFICEQCHEYLGTDNNILVRCRCCHSKIDRKSNNGSFLYLSLTDQLREVFGMTDAHHLYSKSRQKRSPYAVEDLFDGKAYKKVMVSDDLISINFNVDGAPIFESSNTSAYPVLSTINELSPCERRNHVLMCSVWFGTGKPKNMNSYLTPFVHEAEKLYEEGFTYTYNGQIHKKRVVTLMGICDSVARPLVQCTTQLNGKYGCGLCLHPGESIEKGRGFARVYPAIDGDFFGDGLRTHQETLVHAQATKKKERKGIKKESILCDIPMYDIITNIDVDWMHCVALSVCRQFANLWFDSTNSGEAFYFGNVLDEVDSWILSLSPTSDFSRIPKGLKERGHMKAHEWVIFLLAYSLSVLNIFFPAKYVKHWALLVDGIAILTKKSIMKSEIVYADKCLKEFLVGVESLYGKKYVSFNVHLLAHLGRSVENWGPLFTHSAFIYEDFNQSIENSVKSPNGVSIQICDLFRLKCVIDRLKILCRNELTNDQSQFLEKLINKKTKPTSNLELGNCKVLGKATILNKLGENDSLVLRKLGVYTDDSTTIYSWKRCIMKNEIITSEKYNQEKKRKN